MHTVRRRMSNGSIKEFKFGGSVEDARASRNMKDYFDKQDKREIGMEVRCADVPTHQFNK